MLGLKWGGKIATLSITLIRSGLAGTDSIPNS